MAYRSIEEIKNIVTAYYNILTANGLPVEKVFLFGSQLRDIHSTGSDIDIAVVLKSYKKDRFAARLELMKYCRSFDELIEPHPFLSEDFNNNEPLTASIVKEGIQIYSSKPVNNL